MSLWNRLFTSLEAERSAHAITRKLLEAELAMNESLRSQMSAMRSNTTTPTPTDLRVITDALHKKEN